ncbi:MAG: MarR family winged helix-turn-helix transcriptional regulator [Pseudomonadota bacterium]
MSLQPHDSPGYLINHLARLFAASLQARIKPMGLSTGVFPVMLHLWQRDGQTQRDLVERVGIEQATMANTLSRMERDGLIARRPDPEDRRSRRIWLTERGSALREKATSAAREENESVLGALSQDERQQLVALIRKTIKSFDGSDRPS